jgi:DNA-binding Xre family transcriptional regulator
VVTVDTERISFAMWEGKMSIVKLARESGMSYHGCWNLCRGRTTAITFETLEGLCRALHLQPGDILTRASGDGEDNLQEPPPPHNPPLSTTEVETRKEED